MTRHLATLTLYRPRRNRWADSIEFLTESSMSDRDTTHKKKSRNIRFFPAFLSFGHRCPVRNVPTGRYGGIKNHIFKARAVWRDKKFVPTVSYNYHLFKFLSRQTALAFTPYLSRETCAVCCASCVPSGGFVSHPSGRMKNPLLTLRSLPSTGRLSSRRLLGRISN